MNRSEIDNYTHLFLMREISLMEEAITAFKRKVEKPHVIAKLIAECENRIFNAAMGLGDFDLARKYANTVEKKLEISRLTGAFRKDADAECKCIPETIPVRNGFAEIPTVFMWRRIYNSAVGAWSDIYKCSKCNFLTANPNAVAADRSKAVRRAASLKENSRLKDEALLVK